MVTKGQIIKIQISGGNEMTVVPNLTNMTKEEAIIELLKVGFLYENISFGEKYNTGILPECVVDVTPHQIGSTISKYSKITINMNTYVTTTTQTTTTLATKPITTKKTTTTTKPPKTTVAETTE